MMLSKLKCVQLSSLCPNAPPEAHLCPPTPDGVAYVGKAQNAAIGRFVVDQGCRGVFPWAANYDDPSGEHNNSLAVWPGQGLNGGK